jgi:hypothetical protein
VDLGFDHYGSAAQPFGYAAGFLGVGNHLAARNGNPELRKDLFRLIFMNFHIEKCWLPVFMGSWTVMDGRFKDANHQLNVKSNFGKADEAAYTGIFAAVTPKTVKYRESARKLQSKRR